MNRLSALFTVLWYPVVAFPQTAIMEVPGVFGELIPIYAAVEDVLFLHETPNLESALREVPYGKQWKIPYVKSEGLTRIITFGEIEVTEEETLTNCVPFPENGETQMTSGDIATYLYYLGEGIARVRAKDAVCELDIADARILSYPEVQSWLKVLFRDGSSPGWLLNDGTQTINAGFQR